MNANFSLNFVMYCKKIWREYLLFSLEYGIDEINFDVEDKFLKKKYNLKLEKYNEKKQKHPLNVLHILNDFKSFNSNKNTKINYLMNGIFENELESYYNYCKNILNNADRTIKSKINGVSYFIQYLINKNLNSLTNITKELVLNYLDSYKDIIKSKKILLNYSLRNFLDYLFLENIIENNFSTLIPVVKRNCKKNFNSFDKEDVNKILKYLKENRFKSLVGYRNYAMILIAAKTGLRKIDILNLKYSNINWEANEINLTQQKTKKRIKLPLLQDVGSAIIEYIKKERPYKLKNNEDYIFISTKYPLEKLTAQYSFYPYIKKAMIECKIDYNKYKKIGLHSFRFTLATEMLNNEISLNIISSSLGHTSPNAIYTYLKTNEKKLAKCIVEVEYEL